MKTRSTLFVLGIVALLSVSCGKQGPAGPAGTPGTNGLNGNANVVSQTDVVNTWTWDNTLLVRYATLTDNQITSAITSSGAVMMYMYNSTANVWFALPLSTSLSTTVTQHIFFNYATGSVQVEVGNSDTSDPNPGSITFKTVCIAASALAQHPNLDLTDYKAVAKAFKLN